MDVTHIDTCLGCYLTDHHNRPGELLIGVPVNGNTTYQDVMDDLIQSLNTHSMDPSEFDYDAAEAAIRDEFSTVSDMSKPFDPSLEVSQEDSDMCEEPEAWFLFEFDEEAS